MNKAQPDFDCPATGPVWLKRRESMNDKQKDLCQAVGMASDMPVLLRRAIEGYDNNDLKPNGFMCIMNAKSFLEDYEKLERQYAGVLEELGEMSGLDILEVGYDD